MDDGIRRVLAEHGRLLVEVETLADDDDLYQAGLTSHANVTVMLQLEDPSASSSPTPCSGGARSSRWPPSGAPSSNSGQCRRERPMTADHDDVPAPAAERGRPLPPGGRRPLREVGRLRAGGRRHQPPRGLTGLGPRGHASSHLPPVESRRTFEETNYLRSFPDMVGSVDVFTGNDRDHADLVQRMGGNKDWWELMEGSDLVLCPSALPPRLPAVHRDATRGGPAVRHPGHLLSQRAQRRSGPHALLRAARAGLRGPGRPGRGLPGRMDGRWPLLVGRPRARSRARRRPTTPSSAGWAACSPPTSSTPG